MSKPNSSSGLVCYVQFALIPFGKAWMPLLSYPSTSVGFASRLSRLKARDLKSRGPAAEVHNIFDTVIGFCYTGCHNTL